jgi:hypothetical protein
MSVIYNSLGTGTLLFQHIQIRFAHNFAYHLIIAIFLFTHSVAGIQE